MRAHTAACCAGTAAARAGVVGLHALAALAALVGPRVVGLLVDEVTSRAPLETVDRLASPLAVSVVVQTVLTWFARRASFMMGEDVFAELREQFMPGRLRCRCPRSSGPAPATSFAHDQRRRGALPRRAVRRSPRCSWPRSPTVAHRRGGVPHRLAGGARRRRRGRRCSWFSTRWYLRLRAGRLPARARDLRRGSTASSPRRSTAPGRWTPWGCGRRRRARIDEAIGDCYDAEMLHAGAADAVVPAGRVRLPPAGRRHPAVGRLAGRRRPRHDRHGHRGRPLRAAAGRAARRAAHRGSTRSRSAPPRWRGSSASPTCRRTAPPTGESPRDEHIEVEDVRYCLPRRPRRAARASRWTCVPGERLAIVGPSGAGKSTLGRLHGRHRRSAHRAGRRRRRAAGRPRAGRSCAARSPS